MRQRVLRNGIAILLAGSALAVGASRLRGATPAKGAAAGPSRLPKLVVLIAVDQLRADYPERFRRFFGEGGFNRFYREGRVFTQAKYTHAITMTGPGHSVMGSGIYADRSGIVGNRWYSFATGDAAYCASGLVRDGAPGECAPEGSGEKETPGWKKTKSPCAFGGPTLAERVKERYPEARVVGVSVKDRAAILMVGKRADAAYWLESKKDGSATVACSEYYPACRREILALGDEEGISEKPGDPAGMTLFRRHPAWREWTWSLPVSCEELCPDDVPEAHAEEAGIGKRFPHPVKDAESLLYTPYGADLLEELAEKVVEVHALGKNSRRAPDVLAVSFSSTDYFGHLFGPDSCEVADGMKRLDATLRRFLDFLAARMGKENLLVFLTADHGAAPLPEVSLKKGIPAGRLDLHASVDREKGKVGDLPPLRQRMEYVLAGELGVPMDAATPLAQSYVVAIDEPNLYLNRSRIGDRNLPHARLMLKDYLLHVEGIQEIYTWDEIQVGDAPEAVNLAFRPDRSGDLLVLLRPYWIPLGEGEGTDHGQTYDYDAHVPLMVWGSGVAPGLETGTVDVAQIAPTLASILNLDTRLFSRPTPLRLGSGK